ncbi:tenascin-X-like [Lepisosteus oculatus]|uniref:tenascin-X-like n=1 Tax=Lepisosteus oculatus TaxID=7918 RepID=UPI0035F5292C
MLLLGLQSPSQHLQVVAVAADNVTVGSPVSITTFTGSYRVEVSGPTAQSLTVSTSSVQITGLSPGSNYSLQVVAVAADNVTVGSPVSITTFTVPGSITNLTASNITTSSLLLSWTAPSGNVGSYSVEVSGPTAQSLTVSTSSVQITGLSPGSNYSLQVVAVAADNVTVGSPVSITTFTGSYRVEVSGPTAQSLTVSTSSVQITGLSPGSNYSLQVVAVAADNVTVGSPVSITTFTGSYRVEVSGPTAQSLTVSTSSVQITGLSPGSNYSLQVVAVAADNVTVGSPVSITTFTVPGSITNLTASNITTSSLLLSWTAPSGNVGSYSVEVSGPTAQSLTVSTSSVQITGLSPGSNYSLQVVAVAADNVTVGSPVSITTFTGSYRVEVSGPTAQSLTVSTSSVQITGLSPGSNYSLQVVAVAADNVTVGSPVSITTFTVPGSITNLTASNITTSSLLLSWTAPSGNVGSYRVEVSGPTAQSLTVSTSSVQITGLSPGSNYSLQVVAVAADNVTVGSPVSITTFTVPGSITNLTASNITTSSLLLSWTAPSGNVGSYRVEVSGPTAQSLTVSTSSVQITGLSPGSNYSLQVVAVAADNVTVGSPVSITTFTVPGSITNLTASNITTSSLLLSWTAPSGNVGSYRVEVSGPTAQSLTVSTSSVQITGLSPGSNYSLQVVAVAADNVTVGSPVSITTFTVPGSITNLTASNITTSSLLLSWTAPSGNVGSYRVKVSGPTAQSLTVSTSSVQITGLSPGSNYSLQVVAVAADNVTVGSPVSITTFTVPGSITNLTASNITTSSLLLIWTAPSGNVGSYRVEVNGPTAQSLTVSTSSVQITGLSPGSNYSLQVVAVAADNVTVGSPVSITTFTVPGSITNLTASNITTSSLLLSWTAPSGNVGSYRVEVSGPTAQSLTVSTSSVQITGLSPGSNYSLQVVAVAADNVTVGSPVSITTFTVPGSITNLTASNITTSSLLLSWTAPSGNVGSYRVEVSGPTAQSLTVSTSSVQITGLSPGSNYSLQVVAVAADNVTVGSPVSITTFTVPGSITNLTASNITTSSLLLIWTAPSGNVGSYRVEVNGPTAQSLTVSTSSVQITGLSPGSNYSLQVVAVAADNVTVGSPVSITTFTVPGSITNLTASNITTSSLLLSWTAPSGNVGSYRVEVSGPTAQSLTVSTSSVQITGLSPGSNYSLQVVAVAADNVTVGSPVSITTFTVPGSITNLTASNITTSSLLLSWTAPSGNVGSYRVEVSGPTAQSLTVSTSSVQITGLSPGSNYSLQVVAVAADNVTVGSPVSITTFTVPGSITNLTASNITTSSLLLSWTAPSGNVGSYRVKVSGPTAQSLTVSTSSVQITGLSPGSNYSLQVVAVAADNVTVGSPVSITTFTVPGSITNLTASNITTSSLLLIWTAPSGNVGSYRVEVNGPTAQSLTVSTSSVQITGLSPGSNYSLQVVAVAADNVTVGSPVSITTFTVPGSITNLTASNITTSSLLLSWTAPSGNVGSYRVEVSGPTAQSLTVSTSSVQITGLSPGSNYSLQVVAVAADNVTVGSPVSITTFTVPGSITNLTASNITTSSLLLSWTAPSGNVGSYRVEVSGPTAQSLTVSTSSVQITGLSPGSNYSLQVVAVAADNVTVGSPVSITTFTVPGSITNLTASNITTSSLLLSWTAPSGNVGSYRVEVNGPTAQSLTVSTSSVQITGLSPGSNYSLQVVAVAADNVTVGSPVSITTFTVPGSITNLTASNITTSSLLLSWTAPSGNVGSYRVEVSGPTAQSLTVSTSSVQITGLSPGSNYSLQVVAVAADNVTVGSPVSITTFTVPGSITNLTASNITTSSLLLSWTAPSGNVGSYRVEVSGPTAQSLTVSTSSVQITGLSPGSNYSLQVVAVAADNVTVGSPVSITTFTVPGSITNLTASNITTSSLLLSWTAPSGNVGSYRVEVSGPTAQSLTVSTSSVQITGLSPGSNYSLQVVAVAAHNVTVGSPVSITTFTVPGSITNLTASNITTSSLLLSWTAPSGNVGSYRVKVSGPTAQSLTVSTSSVQITGLSPGSNYSLQVVAVAADNVTVGSPVSITTFTVPGSITNLTASNITTSSLLLSWTAPSGNVGSYRVEVSGPTAQSLTVSTSSVQITGLSPGSNYSLQVVAVAADNVTVGSPVSITTFTVPGSITNLTASNITTSSLLLSWTAPSGNVGSYRVKVSGPTAQSLTVSTSSVQITGLSPGSNYSLQVVAVAADNVTVGSPVSITTFTVPGSITSLTASNITTSSLLLIWTAPSGNVGSYRVEVNGPTAQSLTVSTSSVQITGLSPGSNYSLQVVAVAADNVTVGSPVSITTFTVPGSITNLTASNITTSSLLLSWTAPSGNVGSYRVEVSGPTAQSLTVSTSSVQITGLSPGSNYSLQVVAVAADNVTVGSPVSITTFTVPGSITNLTASDITTSSLLLSWTAPSGNVGSYRVEVSGPTAQSLTVSTSSVQITGLSPGSNYSLQVVAVAADNVTVGSPVSITTFTVSGSITNLTASNITTSSLLLSWTAPSGNVGSYRVEVSGPTAQSLTVSTSSVQITGLSPGSNYSLQVVAVAADNVTVGSPVSITTFTVPGSITNLTASNINTSSLLLNWTAPSGNVGSYRVEVSGPTAQSLTVSTSSVQITGLSPGSNYSLQVVAVAADNVTVGSPVSITTFTVSGSITNLTASNITTSSLLLSWTAPSGNVGSYRVEVSGPTAQSLTVSTSSVQITGLSPGSNYSLQVVAVAADNVTVGSPVSITTFTENAL